MKHPQYRVSDILYLDKTVLTELLTTIGSWLTLLDWSQSPKLVALAKQYQVPLTPRLEIVGSYAFGNASLHSDLDCNLAWPNWDLQQAARMLFYVPAFRQQFAAVKERWGMDHGLRVDVGCVDAKSIEYNIHLDCDTMLLHFRYEPDVDFYNPGSLTLPELDRVETFTPVHVLRFDPAKDTPPPVHNIHLKLDNYAFRWLPYPRQVKRPASFAVDEYAAEQAEWQRTYGARYTGYTEQDGKLVEA